MFRLSKSVQDELRELKEQFLKSIEEYLDDCVLLEDVKRMRGFIANVSGYLRDEVAKAEKKKRWYFILKDVKLRADFRSKVSLDEALEILEIEPERVEEAI